MSSRPVITALLVACSLATAMALPGGSGAATSLKRCGEADIGFTDAKVRGRNVSCERARSIVSGWAKRSATLNDRGECTRANDYCRRIRYRRYRCRVSGGGVAGVKLRCKRGKRVVRANWG